MINCISIDVTTVCDRACKDCCCGINMGLRPAIHHAWEYFENIAKYIYGFKRVHLTGGEPTTSPIFSRLAKHGRELFGCKEYTLQTDGFKALQYSEEFKNFDHIYFSRYDSRNAVACDFIKLNYPSTEWDGTKHDFVPRERRGSGNPCGREETMAIAGGKMWPCCVAPGIPGAVSMDLDDDWMDKIESIPLACTDCWFSP